MLYLIEEVSVFIPKHLTFKAHVINFTVFKEFAGFSCQLKKIFAYSVDFIFEHFKTFLSLN